MRLNKYLAKAGIASRRKADNLIRMATTTVNGNMVLDPAYNVVKDDEVRYDGKVICPNLESVVLMLNKPKGVITSLRDNHGRETVMNYISSKYRLVPIGRLDKDSTGLLLLTNDGDLHHYLTHPKNHIERDYQVIIERRLSSQEVKKIAVGLSIGLGQYGKAQVISQKKKKGRTFTVLRLRQGKKREIRRIFQRLKITLFSLHRFRFSTLELGRLKEGEYRELLPQEIIELKQ